MQWSVLPFAGIRSDGKLSRAGIKGAAIELTHLAFKLTNANKSIDDRLLSLQPVSWVLSLSPDKTDYCWHQ